MFFSSQAESRQSGFTIIEVMIVVVIMGILSGFAVNSFYQQAFRQAVQGEAKQAIQFLNMANMYVKKTGEAASIAIDSTGMYLRDEASCGGNIVRENEFETGIELAAIDSSGLTGLPAGIGTGSGQGFLGSWDSCIELTPQVGNTLEDAGGVVLGNFRLPDDEKYNIAIVKATENINFRTYVSIAGGAWGFRK